MPTNPREWALTLEYLPKFMRDFHDQKDIFKRVDEMVAATKAKQGPFPGGDMNWVSAHIYTIDHFLFFMALHGYTLQRSRKKDIGFYDLEKTIEDFKQRQLNLLGEIIK